MQSMSFASTARKVTAFAAAAATLLALGACGNSNNGSAGNNGAKSTSEPQEGVPTNYTGSFPMPDPGKAYNNPKDRGELKQGGTLTLPITEIGPNWNAIDVNGNTVYMSGLWRFYMPCIWEYPADGSLENIKPNTNYVTKVEQTSDSPETVVFTINDKASWNDGTPITWKDFESTWKVQSGKSDKFTPALTTGYDQIKSVTKGDTDKQAVVTFEKDFYPYQSLFNLLYPSEALTGDDTKDGDTFSKGWSNDSHSDKWGAGPFVVSKSSDSEVTFTPNPKWWGDKPLLDKVVLKQMEPSAAMNAFKNGEIDAVGASDAESMTSAKTVKDAYLRRSYDSGVYTLTINTKNIPLEVRKAFVQGVDRSQLQKIDFQGIEWTEKTPGSLILPQFQDGYEDNMPAESKFSTANAIKTLEDAGYKKNSDGYYEKGGKVAAITYTTFSDSASTKAKATAIQKMAKTVGIKVSIDIKASNTFSDTVSSGNWDMIGLGWSASDPFGYASSAYQLYGSKSESNFSFTGTDEIDKELESIPGIKDSTKAIAQFNKAEKEAQKLYAQIPFENGQITVAVKKGLANYGPAGYSSGARVMVTVHPENLGWEK